MGTNAEQVKGNTMCNLKSDVCQEIFVVDSHTEGEPTRIVMGGGPDLGEGTLAEKLERFGQEYDFFRSAVVNEPRGSDVFVGALYVKPSIEGSIGGVLFFNNVGYLGMCGHGTIGLVKILSHLDRISPGSHLLETPVGNITVTLAEDGLVSLTNVPSYRTATAVTADVPGYGVVTGDIAWGGNWFFLSDKHTQRLEQDNIEQLTDYARKLRKVLNEQGHPEVDHIELCGPAVSPEANARNFVLCPGSAYDRSPCGTGTSAKIACLAADGKLAEGETWVQESIIGSRFYGHYQSDGDRVIPTISGRAYVTAVSTLYLYENDPFRWGIRG